MGLTTTAFREGDELSVVRLSREELTNTLGCADDTHNSLAGKKRSQHVSGSLTTTANKRSTVSLVTRSAPEERGEETDTFPSALSSLPSSAQSYFCPGQAKTSKRSALVKQEESFYPPHGL